MSHKWDIKFDEKTNEIIHYCVNCGIFRRHSRITGEGGFLVGKKTLQMSYDGIDWFDYKGRNCEPKIKK